MWPGRRKSPARVSGSASAVTVVARSSAETPVVVPSRASTDTVKAVRFDSVLRSTICGRSSWSSRSPVIGWQTIPLVWRIMNAIFSGVAFSAAMIRSPSFSRSASSATMTSSPAAIARMPSSIDDSIAARILPLADRPVRAILRARRGLDGQAALSPADDSAGHVVRLPPSRAKGLGGHRRPRAHLALEDHRQIARELPGALGQPGELDVPRAGDPPLLPLVRLAGVHQQPPPPPEG